MRTSLIVPVLSLTAALAGCGSSDEDTPIETTLWRTSPIIGGVVDDNADHDGVVILVQTNGSSIGGMCTGSVISQPGEKGVILTARHCVTKVSSGGVTCKNDVLGDLAPSSMLIAKGARPSPASPVILGGKGERIFMPGGASLCGTDIALIVMEQPISGVIPLRVRTEKGRTAKGEKFTAIGYGQTSSSGGGGVRYRRENVEVKGLGPMMGQVKEGEFQGGVSICSGDSGGPAVSANYAVMGVTSRGADGCNTDYNFWSTVEFHKDLIDEAFAYAKSTYQDEDGLFHDGSGDPGVSGDPCGSGDPCVAGALCFTDPDTGKTACATKCRDGVACAANEWCDEDSDIPVCRDISTKPPPCGDVDKCGEGQTCATDPSSGKRVCGQSCTTDDQCGAPAICDPDQKVCMTPGKKKDSGCSVGSTESTANSGWMGLALLAAGIASVRRRFSSR